MGYRRFAIMLLQSDAVWKPMAAGNSRFDDLESPASRIQLDDDRKSPP